MKNLFLHQAAFLKKNPNRGLLLWEVGTGKMLAGVRWLSLRPNHKALVICPKGIVKKWKEALEEDGVKADVITRDEIKKTDISTCKALIIDECHDFAAPLFTKQRSQRAQKLYNHFKEHPDTHTLLLSATPIRSTPYNLHTLYCYLGKYIKIQSFRDNFFHMTNKFGSMHYEPNTDWRVKIRPYLESVADIVLMSDCIDVPVHSHTVVKIKEENYTSDEYLEPSAQWHAMHKSEQNEYKWKALKELIDGYQKIMVVCYYREQIDDYIKRIGDERQVYVIHGGIKDQESVIQAAQESKDCVFIVQSSLGSGFDADTFSTMVFASQGYSYVSYVQMLGRINRISNLHKNQYYYLQAGECDRAVYNAMEKHSDFDPIKYLNERNSL